MFVSRLLVTTCLPAPLSDHEAAAQPACSRPAAVLSGRCPSTSAAAFPTASQRLRAVTQPDAPQYQQRVGDWAQHTPPEEATSQPYYFYWAATDGPGEEVPEAEVLVHSW